MPSLYSYYADPYYAAPAYYAPSYYAPSAYCYEPSYYTAPAYGIYDSYYADPYYDYGYYDSAFGINFSLSDYSWCGRDSSYGLGIGLSLGRHDSGLLNFYYNSSRDRCW